MCPRFLSIPKNGPVNYNQVVQQLAALTASADRIVVGSGSRECSENVSTTFCSVIFGRKKLCLCCLCLCCGVQIVQMFSGQEEFWKTQYSKLLSIVLRMMCEEPIFIGV